MIEQEELQYAAYLSDGHFVYHGVHDHTAIVPAMYNPLFIDDSIYKVQFNVELLAHQQVKTDFLTFIEYSGQNEPLIPEQIEPPIPE
ncbi:MAG: DUF1398 family protein [Saprospiraceae bacterium]|nr:DUF1398 family protein [Saprospiraceae bacterium]